MPGPSCIVKLAVLIATTTMTLPVISEPARTPARSAHSYENIIHCVTKVNRLMSRSEDRASTLSNPRDPLAGRTAATHGAHSGSCDGGRRKS